MVAPTVDASATTNTGAGTSHSITIPANNEDDLIVVSASSTDAASSISAPSGDWTVEYNQSISAISPIRFFVAHRKAPAGGLSSPQTFTTASSEEMIAVANVISGQDLTTPVDVKSTVNTGTNNLPTNSGVTTTVDDTLVLSFMSADDDDGNSTMNPGGTTMGASDWIETTSPGNGNTVGIARVAQATAGPTGSKTWSLSFNEEWGSAIIAIAPAASVITGTADSDLPSVTQDADGKVIVAGSADSNLPSAAQAAQGAVLVKGLADSDIPFVAQTSQGKVLIKGVGDSDIPFVTQQAKFFNRGIGVNTLPLVSQGSAGLVKIPDDFWVKDFAEEGAWSPEGAAAASWSSESPASDSWNKESAASDSWSEEAGVAGSWSKEGSL